MAAPTAAEDPNLDLDKTASPYKIDSHLVDDPKKQQPPTSLDQQHDSRDESKTDRNLDHSNRASSTDTDLDVEKAGADIASDGEGQAKAGPQTESEEEPEYPSNKKLIPNCRQSLLQLLPCRFGMSILHCLSTPIRRNIC